MDANNPIKYSDLVKEDDAIVTLIAQLQALSGQYSKTVGEIKAEAAQLATSLGKASGATDEGRTAIRKASEEADRLAAAQRKLEQARSANREELARLKRATKEANDMAKLEEKLNNSAEGSYNRLSAQYSLNKMRLNAMSEEMRHGTEEGRQLEKETAEIYEQMKKLQEATGKYTLDVGHYEVASRNLKSELKDLVGQIAGLTIQYQELSEEERAGAQGQALKAKIAGLTEEAGTLRDAIADTNEAISNAASDTRGFDQLNDALQTITASFGLAQGAAVALGVSDEDLQRVQTKLMAAMTALNSLQTIQTKLQKQSALMQGIRTLQTKAATAAENLDTAAKSKNIVVSKAATVAQAAFNLVAEANPYVLLATAIVTVIGAVAAYVVATKNAAEAEKLHQAAIERKKKAMQEKNEVMDKVMDEYSATIAKIRILVAVAKDENRAISERNAACAELNKLEPKIHANINTTTGLFVAQTNEIEKLVENLDKYYQMLAAQEYLEELYKKQNALKVQQKKLESWQGGAQYNVEYYGKQKATGTYTATKAYPTGGGAPVVTQYEELTEEGRKAADLQQYYAESLNTATTALKANKQAQSEVNAEIEAMKPILLETAKANAGYVPASKIEPIATPKATTDAPKQEDILKAQREAEERAYQLRVSLTRKYQDVLLASERDAYAKKRSQIQYQYTREIEDLQHRLNTDIELQKENSQERQIVLDTIAQIQSNADAELERLDAEHAIAELKQLKDAIALRLEAVAQGSEQELQLRREMLAVEEEIAQKENALLQDGAKKSESDIAAKYAEEGRKIADEYVTAQMAIFDQQQKLADTEFELLRNSEGRKTRYRLQAEKDRIAKVLEMNELAGHKLTDLEKKQLEAQMALYDKQIKESEVEERGKDMYGLLGLNLDEKQKEAINTSYQFAAQQLADYMAKRTEAAQAAVEQSNKEVDSAKSRLDAEIAARQQGYASNVELAQKELEAAKQQQQKALEDKKKAQRQELALQSIQEAGNLVLATTKIWGQLGFPWALPAIGVMWGSFAASKVKAFQATRKTEYRDGTVELLRGGSHASGHDIDLGTAPDGTQRRAEGGEFFAVINKRNSRRFRNIIPDVINSLNDGSFTEKYMADGSPVLNVNVNGNKDLGALASDVRDIRMQGQMQTSYDAQGNKIVQYKNLKRIVKK